MSGLFQLKEGTLSDKHPACCFSQQPYEFLYFQSCTDQKKHVPCGSWPTAIIPIAEPQTHILRAVSLQTICPPVHRLWAEKSWVRQCRWTSLAWAELWVQLLQTRVSSGAGEKPQVHVVEGRAGSPSAHSGDAYLCPLVPQEIRTIIPGPLWDSGIIHLMAFWMGVHLFIPLQ